MVILTEILEWPHRYEVTVLPLASQMQSVYLPDSCRTSLFFPSLDGMHFLEKEKRHHKVKTSGTWLKGNSCPSASVKIWRIRSDQMIIMARRDQGQNSPWQRFTHQLVHHGTERFVQSLRFSNLFGLGDAVIAEHIADCPSYTLLIRSKPVCGS